MGHSESSQQTAHYVQTMSSYGPARCDASAHLITKAFWIHQTRLHVARRTARTWDLNGLYMYWWYPVRTRSSMTRVWGWTWRQVSWNLPCLLVCGRSVYFTHSQRGPLPLLTTTIFCAISLPCAFLANHAITDARERLNYSRSTSSKKTGIRLSCLLILWGSVYMT